nr:putative ribonuclease H-like domain-containing protein [Tanacetum cinerariifolium]
MQEELLQFKLQKVWVPVDLPKGKRAIGSKWVFRNKKDERGIVIRNKVILVAHGHTQEEGIDYDEVFAPVAKIKAIRTIEEEVYVCEPLGFEDPTYPDKIYKVVKALYGLHQASRAWYETLANYLLENGFQRGKIDQSLSIKKQKRDILLVQVYVDNIIIGSTNKELYVKSASTPIETEEPLLKDPDGKDVDVHIYRSMIGLLMYLTSSRPDIMFAVCACVRFQVTLKVSHLYLVKRIFRYLKGKPHLGLWYPRYSPFNLVAYSDNDYAGASLDRKSTTEGKPHLGLWYPRYSPFNLVAYSDNDYARASLDRKSTTEVEKVNGDVQLQALIVDKKVVVLEAIIRQYLRLDDADRRIAWNAFSSSLASAIICLATIRKFNFSKYIFDSMVRNVDSPSVYKYGESWKGVETPFFASMMVQLQPQAKEGVEVPITHAQPSTSSASSPTKLQDTTCTSHDTPLPYQPPTLHALPPQDQPTPPYDSSMPLLTTLMETCVTLSQKGEIAAIDADEGTTLEDVETDEKEIAMDAESQGKTNLNSARFDREDIVALWNLVKEIFSLAEPSEDKERVQRVKLKRLFEPDENDVLRKLQRYMHAPLIWKLDSDYGVHHVSSTRGRNIYMLT